ncbi:MAG: NAD(P)H-hydrate dehydratase [Bacteroidia bacterium]|nr:NAD(P)H-hydrate dehydratase [Bacteroidia bacterium]NNC86161.1 NAD(P)H-hydrate dehydratase [Bacteroidia bacterium]NNM16500.1 NAD(P)H-hydrate dehydratase [Bacteroidia bacterium]
MKILSALQIRELDAFTIEHEPIKSIDLMERAAQECFDWIINKYSKEHSFKIFCGLGNNSGDGLVIARLLYQAGYKVQPFIIRYSDNTSDDFKINEVRLFQLDLSLVRNVYQISDVQKFEKNDVLIDCIFGSGLTRPTEGLVAEVIQLMNNSKQATISIDFPSGLFADKSSISTNAHIVTADYTLSFQLPKLAFLLPENEKYIGEVHIFNIGLDQSYIQDQETDFELLEIQDVKQLIQTRKRFSHKGTFGHALIAAGSIGKMGAAVLASKACLRTGAGLVTTQTPTSGYSIMQIKLPEVMVQQDISKNYISEIANIENYDVIGIGPGLGTEKSTQKGLKKLFQSYKKPMVIDADAINILGLHKTWISLIPEQSILTPHPKEFERLVGASNDNFERLRMQSEFSLKYNLFVILKGHYTCITSPDGKCYFNTSGNPGMATAGTGDVLTGILTGLLAQGYSELHACLIGVFIHGLAGDISADKMSQQAMLSSDIIDNIGAAYKLLELENEK